ncbi:SH3 domain-binding protein 5-like isoform X2 [Spodoptera litura]|uniref:SH3 domain-binding protein 5-like n=1 Tax=Spodoptera litura TaxID=69820 RepID=A0A9J7DY35_SPOLT|nr:SH3 domain-binding protein 5-like isoform X2 [Spodoptera litura]
MNDSAAECSEALDPRVQIELERLNTATDEINRLEVELDEARLAFRRLLAEGHLRIQQLTKKLGTSVHKARPYYEARFRANITSQELQTATVAYDKANSAHAAAREMVYLAEQGLARLAEGGAGVTLDPAWQEMLNHATHRVNQAESDRAHATVTQRTRAAAHRAASTLVHQLQSSLKRHIAKSRPYFEEKARINTALEAQKARIQTLEEQVSEAKQQYSSALRNLERISDEIHKHRSRRQSARNVPEIDRSTTTDTASDTNTTSSDKLDELCDSSTDASVREWLRRAAHHRPRPPTDADTWTEIDLDYSSPEEVGVFTLSRSGSVAPRTIARARLPTPTPGLRSIWITPVRKRLVSSLCLGVAPSRRAPSPAPAYRRRHLD